MKTIIKTVVILGLCSLTYHCYSQDNRDVAWVHGLGQNASFWKTHSDLFQSERQINSTRTSAPGFASHTTNAGVSVMAQQIRSLVVDNTTNIGIGHSMGGVALREVVLLDSAAGVLIPNFGGIITVGSPMNGAKILNALSDGRVTAALQHGARQLTKGPLAQLGLAVYLVGSFVVNLVLEKKLPNALNNVMSGFGASGVDLQEGSNYMAGTSNFFGSSGGATSQSINIPSISIHGNENSPVHWCLLSAYESNGADDTKYVKWANTVGDVYNVAYTANLAVAVAKTVLGFWNPFSWSETAHTYFIAFEWKSGRDYIRYHSETDWDNLIGATRTEQVQQCHIAYYNVFVCPPSAYYYCDVDPHSQDAYCGHCWEKQPKVVCKYVTVSVRESSDGLIHKSSQTGSNSAWNGAVVEAVGVNHAEMGTHKQIRKSFREIFDNPKKFKADDFFKLKKRK